MRCRASFLLKVELVKYLRVDQPRALADASQIAALFGVGGLHRGVWRRRTTRALAGEFDFSAVIEEPAIDLGHGQRAALVGAAAVTRRARW